MRKPYFAAPVLIGVVAVMAGCGQTVAGAHNAADASRTSSSPAATSTVSAPSSGSPGAGNPAGGAGCAAWPAGSVPGKSLLLSNTTMGKTYCVSVGTGVLIFLHGTPSLRWAPIRVSSNVLQPRANGRLALALGVTGASYAAVRPGTAIITSYRPACAGSVPTASAGSPAAVASPPTMMCGALIGFRVTVVVR